MQPAKPQGNDTKVGVKPEAIQAKPANNEQGMDKHLLNEMDRAAQEKIMASLNRDGAVSEAEFFINRNKDAYNLLLKSEQKKQVQQAIIDEVRTQAGKTGLGQDLSSIYDAVSKKVPDVSKAMVLGALSIMHDNNQIRMSGWPKTVGEIPDLTMTNLVSNKLMYYAGPPGGNVVNLKDVIEDAADSQSKLDTKPETKPETKTSVAKPTGKTSGGSFEQMQSVIDLAFGNEGLSKAVLQPFEGELDEEIKRQIKAGTAPIWYKYQLSLAEAVVAKQRVAKAISSKLKESLGSDKIKESLKTIAGSAKNLDDYRKEYNSMSDEDLCAAILVNRWAITSGDHDKISCRIQETAMEVFGLDEKSTHKNWKPDLTDGATPLEKEVYKAFIQATYEHTQETLKKAGIKELVLYRGLALDSTFKPGKDVEMQTQPLSSFAYSHNVARDFAEGAFVRDDQEPMIIATKVPIDRVFSLWTTGNGCMSEDEVVVIGGPGTCTLGRSGATLKEYWNQLERDLA